MFTCVAFSKEGSPLTFYINVIYHNQKTCGVCTRLLVLGNKNKAILLKPKYPHFHH